MPPPSMMRKTTLANVVREPRWAMMMHRLASQYKKSGKK